MFFLQHRHFPFLAASSPQHNCSICIPIYTQSGTVRHFQHTCRYLKTSQPCQTPFHFCSNSRKFQKSLVCIIVGSSLHCVNVVHVTEVAEPVRRLRHIIYQQYLKKQLSSAPQTFLEYPATRCLHINLLFISSTLRATHVNSCHTIVV